MAPTAASQQGGALGWTGLGLFGLGVVAQPLPSTTSAYDADAYPVMAFDQDAFTTGAFDSEA